MNALYVLVILSVVGIALDIAGHGAKNNGVMWAGRVMLLLAAMGWIAFALLLYFIASAFGPMGH